MHVFQLFRRQKFIYCSRRGKSSSRRENSLRLDGSCIEYNKKRSKISKVEEESVQEDSENEDEDSTNKVVTKKQKLQINKTAVNIEVKSKVVKRSRQDNLSIEGDCIDNYLINVQTPVVVKQTTISYGLLQNLCSRSIPN